MDDAGFYTWFAEYIQSEPHLTPKTAAKAAWAVHTEEIRLLRVALHAAQERVDQLHTILNEPEWKKRE